ncbi:MAG: hypothetical protein ACRKFN_10835 [Desulfitobacterium sp.]
MTKYVYSPQFLELRKIVNKVDPIGLIKICCPDDEYDPEVIDILKLIPESQSIQQLAAKTHEIFVKWFDEEMASNYESYSEIAKLIWANKKRMI